MLKRIVSIGLVLMTVLTLLPVGAWAEDSAALLADDEECIATLPVIAGEIIADEEEEAPAAKPVAEEEEEEIDWANEGAAIVVYILADAVFSDGAAELYCEAECSDGSALAYQWQQLNDAVAYESNMARKEAWADIPGATEPTLSFENVEAEDFAAYENMLYRCIVSTEDDREISSEAKLLPDPVWSESAEDEESIATLPGMAGEILEDEAEAETEAAAPVLTSANGSCGDNLTWTLVDGTLTISGTGAMTDYAYTSEGADTPWYTDRDSIKKVVINEGVTSIGQCAFYYCTSLESFTIPEGVTSIGENAFNKCSGLTSVTIPSSVESIGVRAFFYCSALTTVTILEGVTSIGEGAFSNCSGLTSVTISEGVTSIGARAFYKCSNLTSLTIPGTVTSIGSNAFVSSPLTDVYFLGTADDWKTFKSKFYCFNDITAHICKGTCGDSLTWTLVDGTLTISGTGEMYDYSYEEPAPWNSDKENITTVVIGSGATTIGQYAFYNCTSMTSVVIPSGVTSIGNYAFCECTDLKSVTIPSSVTSIGAYVFYKCSLTSVIIPEGVTSIGEYAFCNCTKLASLTIPGTVTSIGSNAFYNCPLTEVNFHGTQAQWDAISSKFPSTVTTVNTHEQLTEAHAAVTATCTTDGNTAYWSCSVCNKYFSDAECTAEIAENSWVIKASHTPTAHDAVAATCTTDGNTAYWSCSGCNKYFSDAECTAEIEENSWVIKAHHTPTAHDAVAATCTTDGNTAYWSCSACNKYFSDAECANEIAENSWVISAKGHTPVTDPAVAADYYHTGLTEGSHCSVCHAILTAQKTVEKTPMAAPTVKVSGKKATISWKKLTGATGYKVYVVVDGSSTAKVYTVKKGTTTKYVYKSITPGHSYTFWITPVKGKDIGGKGNTKTYTKYLTTPAVKTKVKSSTLTVSWKKITGATSMQVQILDQTTGAVLTSKTLKGTATKTEIKLPKGSYTVRVIARSNASVKTATKKITVK